MKRLAFAIIGVMLMIPYLQAYGMDYEVEPNNDLTDAMPIASGKSLQGNIGSVSDLDNFKFVAKKSGSVRVLFRRPPRPYVFNIATIRVLNAAGDELASVDAYAPRVYTTFDFGTSAGTTYYLEVSGCQQTSSECQNQRSEAYELIAVQLPSPFFESEQNDSLETADAIPPNAWVFAQHSAKTDVDIFRVNLPGAGNFMAQITRPSDPYIYSLSNIALLDANGSLLNSDDVYAPDGQGRVVLGTTEPKLVYLRITSCAQGSQCDITFSNPYQVTTSFQALAELSIANVSVTEGNSGTKLAKFTVKLSQATTSEVTYDIATVDRTATAGSDYVASSLPGQSIAPGATSKTFTVTINGDTTVEVNETFLVKVTKVVGATVARGQATGTIVNDD